MHLIVYTSEYIGSSIDHDILDIEAEAKRNNRKFGITGLLFYRSQRFLQILEGERTDLENLMAILEHDPRHEDVQRLMDEPIKDRSFARWNMDSFNLSSDKKLDKQELIEISQIYKENMSTRSSILVRFYKAMLSRTAA